MTKLSEVTDPSYLGGMPEWSLDDVRARRDAATEVETGLSYLRRMVQGRLDILVAEQRHREAGERGNVSELVGELPAILSDNVHAPGLGRLPALMAPGHLDDGLQQSLERILPADRLARLDELTEDELRSRVERLADFERSISAQRRSVLEVVDRLQEEIVRRYRTGEASVDSLLS